MIDPVFDPDDPRPPYLQVANQLRAAILTRKLAPGEQLPSQSELSEHYGVARATIQQALRVLRHEGLIITRQGSGAFVRERPGRPVGLRPHVDRAFTASDVRIDFAGFTGETFHHAVQESIDRVRDGKARPSSISIRMLIADFSAPLALPVNVTGADPEPLRRRLARTTDRYTGGLHESLDELQHLGLVRSVSLAVRVYSATPMFKMYLLNDEDLFFGFYPVVENHVTIEGEDIRIFDAMGKDAMLFHHAADSNPESLGSSYVAEAGRWFDSVWRSIARPWEHA